MRTYRNLSYDELVALWRREDLRQRASRPTVLFHNAFTPALTSYRWREDDGSTAPESAANLANEDAPYDVDVSSGDVQLFLIVQVEEQGDDSSRNNVSVQLRFDPAGGSSWQNVTATAGNGIHGTADANTAATDEANWPTANFVLTGEEGTAYSGFELTDDAAKTVASFQAANYTEYVFPITVEQANVSDNDTITFNFAIAGTDITPDVTPTLTVTKTGGAQTFNRSGDDGIFLDDADIKEHARPRLDSLFLLETRQHEILPTLLDSLLLGDSVAAGRLKAPITVSDQILLTDLRLSDQIISQIDNLLLLQDGHANQIVTVTGDAFLLADSIAAGRLKPRSATDQILLDDFRTSEQIKTDLDGLELSDDLTKQVLLQQLDNLLLGDSVTATYLRAAIVRSVADTLLLLDDRTSLLEKTISDQVYVVDVMTKTFERLDLDGLLLGDSVTTATAGITLRTIADQLLLSDETVKETILNRLDLLLIVDSVDAVVTQATQAFTRNVTDGLLLDDLQLLEREMIALDGLLLSDQVSIAKLGLQLRSVADALLLGDQRTSVHEMTVVDAAPLRDVIIKTQEMIAGDPVGLFDQVFASAIRQVSQLDNLLLLDSRALAQEITKLLQDQVLLGDLFNKIQEMTALDQLLLRDSVTRSVFEAIIQALVWALLKAQDYLGVRLNFQDYLGIAEGSNSDYLLVKAGFVRTTDLRLVSV